MRILEAAGVPYSSVEYAWDEAHLDAVSAARKLNIDPDMLFKTIVMISEDNEVFVFCVPAPSEVSLKKVRNITGKKITPLKLESLQKTTGYVRGGCSPLGMKKHFPTFIDETAQLFDEINLSGGRKGLGITVSPIAVASCIHAVFADIVREARL